jgi:hypothetical protein
MFMTDTGGATVTVAGEIKRLGKHIYFEGKYNRVDVFSFVKERTTNNGKAVVRWQEHFLESYGTGLKLGD